MILSEALSAEVPNDHWSAEQARPQRADSHHAVGAHLSDRRRIMCEKCAELEKRIARYKEVADMVLDQSAVSSITLLIEQCETKKHELHSEREAA